MLPKRYARIPRYDSFCPFTRDIVIASLLTRYFCTLPSRTMDGLSLAASIIAVIQLAGSCLELSRKLFGPSKFLSFDLATITSALYEFNGAMKTFQTHMEIYEDDEARLSSLENLKPALIRCEGALGVIKDFMNGSGFVGKHLIGPKFDRKLKASLKALDSAKELFMLALHADQQSVPGA